jgi:AraC family transcriptional regulator
MTSRSTEQDYRARVARVVAAIVADPLAEHRLEELAAIAHFSPFHFHRVYASVVGETVSSTVRRVRLARAASLLAQGDESVTQVGQSVGYDSPQAFSRAFGQFAGQSPRAFQQRLQSLENDGESSPMEVGETGAPRVRIVELLAREMLALRHVGPAATIPHTWRLMEQRFGERPMSDWLGLSVGEPDEAEGFAYYVGVTAREGDFHDPALELLRIPAGSWALYELAGPYTRISTAFDAVYSRWMPGSGYEPDQRLALERYLNSPRDTAPADLRTELLIPIRPSSRP